MDKRTRRRASDEPAIVDPLAKVRERQYVAAASHCRLQVFQPLRWIISCYKCACGQPGDGPC